MKLTKPNIDLSKYNNLLEALIIIESKDDVAIEKWHRDLRSIHNTILNEETTRVGLELVGEKLTHSELIVLLASSMVKRELDEAFSEHYSKLLIKMGEESFVEGSTSELEKAKEVRSNAGRLGHSETYELKKQAIEYWRENIDPNLSNDAAAEILRKVVALKFRTLSGYVSEAKREKIHPAS